MPKPSKKYKSKEDRSDPLTRRARPQTEKRRTGPSRESAIDKSQGFMYNIWYHKVPGAGKPRTEPEPPARSKVRCIPYTDAGVTKGEETHSKLFCIYFARGSCTQGYDCMFLHRIPTAADDCELSHVHDIFGRERHHTDRDDMGGVGSFSRENRTLSVTGLPPRGERMNIRLFRAFSEFGEVDRVHAVEDHPVASVRMKYRANAEFAKVAMANQSISTEYGEEVLNIRWSEQDLNAGRAKRDKRETVSRSLDSVWEKHLADAAAANCEKSSLQIDRTVAAPRAATADVFSTSYKRRCEDDGEPLAKRACTTNRIC